MSSQHTSRSGTHGVLSRLKTAATIGAIGATVLALGACGSSDSSSSTSSGSSTSASSGKTQEITVGIPVDDATYAPLYLAVDRDMFAKYGLKVKLVVFQGGAELTKAVAGGSVQLAVSALSEMLPAVEQKQPLVAWYGGYNSAPFVWLAQPGITSIDQAKGKKWGVTKIGSSTDTITRYLLKTNGIDPDTGVKIIGVGGGPAQVAAMKAKQVDVIISSPTTSYQAEAQGDKPIAKFSDLAGEYPSHVAYSKKDFVADHKDEATKFLQGMVDGIKLAKSDPKAGAQAIADHQKVSMDYATRAYNEVAPYWYADGRLPDDKDMDVFWNIGVQAGSWPAKMPMSEWWDPQFVDSYKTWSGGGS
jgi:NitT/TauT family transport system substrate-binding protein